MYFSPFRALKPEKNKQKHRQQRHKISKAKKKTSINPSPKNYYKKKTRHKEKLTN